MKDKEFVVEKIRSQYMETGHTDLDALKVLDAKVKKPARVFGFAYGSIGAVIMGAGMSLVMTDIGSVLGMQNTLLPGTAVGVVGLVMSCSTYPLYKKIFSSRKKKYAPQIMDALDLVMQGDFSVRIPPVKEFAGETGFNEIISAINAMTAELQGTDTLRTDFIANVSHELKTPLAIMGNYATMLQQPGISEEDRIEYAKSISFAARRQQEVEEIRKAYLPREEDKLEQLRRLHSRPTQKAQAASLAMGIVGALILGTGMSLCMTELGASLGDFALALGIPVGVSGILLVSLAYPVFRKTLRTEREKIAPDILKLTDDLLK